MLYSNPYFKFMLEKLTKSKQPGITLGETIFLLQCANAQSVAQQFYPQTDGSQREDQTQSGPTTVNADPMGPEYFEYNSGGDNSNAVNSLSSQAVNCITDLFLIRNYVPLASVRCKQLLENRPLGLGVEPQTSTASTDQR